MSSQGESPLDLAVSTRTVFASSAELHHTLATELSSITFAFNADLIQPWVNVLQFKIARYWIWD